MPTVRYIAPESETIADRLDAMRALAMASAAAEAEYDAIQSGELEDGCSEYPDGISYHDQEQATDRGVDARHALALEVEEAERKDLMHELGHLARTEMGL